MMETCLFSDFRIALRLIRVVDGEGSYLSSAAGQRRHRASSPPSVKFADLAVFRKFYSYWLSKPVHSPVDVPKKREICVAISAVTGSSLLMMV